MYLYIDIDRSISNIYCIYIRLPNTWIFILTNVKFSDSFQEFKMQKERKV